MTLGFVPEFCDIMIFRRICSVGHFGDNRAFFVSQSLVTI